MESTSSLTTLLTRTAEPPDFETASGDVLGFSSSRSDSPQSKRGWLELLPHQRNDLSRCQPKLIPNRIETGPILPCHLDDPVDFELRKDLRFARLHDLPPLYTEFNRKSAHELTDLQRDGPQEAKFTREDLLFLPAPIRLAKEVGQGVGASAVLQRSLSPRSIPPRAALHAVASLREAVSSRLGEARLPLAIADDSDSDGCSIYWFHTHSQWVAGEGTFAME